MWSRKNYENCEMMDDMRKNIEFSSHHFDRNYPNTKESCSVDIESRLKGLGGGRSNCRSYTNKQGTAPFNQSLMDCHKSTFPKMSYLERTMPLNTKNEARKYHKAKQEKNKKNKTSSHNPKMLSMSEWLSTTKSCDNRFNLSAFVENNKNC